jgi:hypothetical protein
MTIPMLHGKFVNILSLTQEKAVDLHKRIKLPNTRDDCRRKHIDHVKNISLYHCMTQSLLLLLFITKYKVKFMQGSNHIEHYRKQLYYPTRTKHDCTSAQCTFKWNISAAGGKQATFTFRQRKPLPRLTADSAVSICTSEENTYTIF